LYTPAGGKSSKEGDMLPVLSNAAQFKVTKINVFYHNEQIAELSTASKRNAHH